MERFFDLLLEKGIFPEDLTAEEHGGSHGCSFNFEEELN